MNLMVILWFLPLICSLYSFPFWLLSHQQVIILLAVTLCRFCGGCTAPRAPAICTGTFCASHPECFPLLLPAHPAFSLQVPRLVMVNTSNLNPCILSLQCWGMFGSCLKSVVPRVCRPSLMRTGFWAAIMPLVSGWMNYFENELKVCLYIWVWSQNMN